MCVFASVYDAPRWQRCLGIDLLCTLSPLMRGSDDARQRRRRQPHVGAVCPDGEMLAAISIYLLHTFQYFAGKQGYLVKLVEKVRSLAMLLIYEYQHELHECYQIGFGFFFGGVFK